MYYRITIYIKEVIDMTGKHTENLKTSSNYTEAKTSSSLKGSATFKDICTKLNVITLKEGMKSNGAVGLNVALNMDLRLKHIDVNMTEFYIKKYRNDNSFPISANALRHEYASKYFSKALEKSEEK
jgi:hypothetical protein